MKDKPVREFTPELLRNMHRQTARHPIRGAGDDGAFPSPILQAIVDPLVIDANALRGEILHMARKSRPISMNAANAGTLRLYCAGHVIDEVDEHLEEWAIEAGVGPDAAFEVWESTCVPLLRRVDIPSELAFTASERARLGRLADSVHGDPDDVPTVQLALLLGVPCLSADHKVLDAVYGEGFGYLDHTDWLPQLRAGGDLGPLGQTWGMTGVAAELCVVGVCGAAMRATRLPLWLVGLLALGGAAAYNSLPQERKDQFWRGTKTLAATTVEILSEVAVTTAEQRAKFDALARPDWSIEGLEEQGRTALITRACMRELARMPQSQCDVDALLARVHPHLSSPTTWSEVLPVLRSEATFVECRPGLFQLGRPVPPLA